MKHLIPFLILSFGYITACSKDNEKPLEEEPDNIWITEAVEAINTQQVIFFSEAVGGDVSFHVYLPEDYDPELQAGYPVIYWLHGGGGGPVGIPPVTDFFHKAMQDENLTPTIIVFPHGLPLGMWCNSKDGKQPVEDMLMQDLLPYVDARYNTRTNRRGRIVEGFSMGGYGAGRLGFLYPDIFGGFSMLAPGPLQLDFSWVAPGNEHIQPIIFKDVFGDDMDYFEAQSPWRLAEWHGQDLPHPTPKRIVVGKLDFVYPATYDFHQHLVSLGIPHQYREFENIGHSTGALFNALGISNWGFYKAIFGE